MPRIKRTVPVDGHDRRIDDCDLNRSFLESSVEGKTVSQSADTDSEQSISQESLSENQSDIDNSREVLSDIEETSDPRESIELKHRISDHILASLNRIERVSTHKSPMAAKAARPRPMRRAEDPLPGGEEETATPKRAMDTTEPSTTDSTSENPMKATPDEDAPKRQQNPGEESTEKQDSSDQQAERESVRESVAKKREQMRMLSKDSVAAKRAKAMLKFQEAGRGPCIADNCRTRGSFESEEQELDRILKAEEEREAKLRERPDKCKGFMQREFDKSAFKPSLYMNLYKEPIILRRVRRKKAEPSAPKKESKPNKTSDLRFKYLHNQKVVSSNAAKHLEQFKRPPFKNPSKYGRSCNDRPAHFALAHEAREKEKQLKIAKEQNKQMLQNRTTAANTVVAGSSHATEATNKEE